MMAGRMRNSKRETETRQTKSSNMEMRRDMDTSGNMMDECDEIQISIGFLGRERGTSRA